MTCSELRHLQCVNGHTGNLQVNKDPPYRTVVGPGEKGVFCRKEFFGVKLACGCHTFQSTILFASLGIWTKLFIPSLWGKAILIATHIVHPSPIGIQDESKIFVFATFLYGTLLDDKRGWPQRDWKEDAVE